MKGVAWLLVLMCFPTQQGFAATPEELLQIYEEKARAQDTAFSGFSAERGESFYREKHAVKGAGVWSCASCHLKDPRKSIVAHKVDIPCRACHVINDVEHPEPKEAKKRVIDPFAPVVNAKRFSDAATVEEFFTRNCVMLLGRECTAAEKGDFISYLLTVK